MHCVQTRSFRTRPETIARTLFRFGRKRRRDLLFAWLTLLPDEGVFPQNAHEYAMATPLVGVLYQKAPALSWQSAFCPQPVGEAQRRLAREQDLALEAQAGRELGAHRVHGRLGAQGRLAARGEEAMVGGIAVTDWRGTEIDGDEAVVGEG